MASKKKHDTKKSHFITTILKAVGQAIKDGKTMYIVWLLYIVISSVITYFTYIYVEWSTNAAYKFTTEIDVNFWEEVIPIIVLISLFIINQIIGSLMNIKKLGLFKEINTKHDFRLTKKLSNMTWESYETQDIQAKISLIKNEGSYSYHAITGDFISWIIYVLMQVIIYLVYIARMKWWIALGFLALSIVYTYIGSFCGKRIHKNYRDTEEIRKSRTYLYNATKAKEPHQDALVNRLYNYLTPKWREMNDLWSNRSIKSDLRRGYYTMIPDIMYALMVCGLMYLTVLEVQDGTKTIGYITTLIGITLSLGGSLKNFAVNMAWYVKDAKIYDDYLDLMATEDEFVNNQNRLGEIFTITFDAVTYIYPQSTHRALNNCTLEIKNHETIAIVGVNGSGKTTFVNILMELSKKYQGNIIVNGKNMNNELGDLRNSCSCIFQDFLQYSFTIRQNITIGNINRTFTDEDIWNILSKVGLREYILTLPDGIDTMLGQIERGLELSKGQWQRLAIARLLANEESRIWILDEPTAYLDPLAEIEMYDFIYQLKGERTVIFISHRLGFAKKAQRIIVFKDGHVIEDSSHDVLIGKSDSEYAKMYEKQKKWYE